MNLRFWLRNNLLRRRLRLLSQRAQAKLFSSLRLPSLLPRLPTSDVDDPATECGLTVPPVSDSELNLRVFSSDRVRLDLSYNQWIAPLLNLPPGTSSSDLKQAAEKLPGYHSQGQYFFPAAAYLKVMEPAGRIQVSWAHRCRATSAVSRLNKEEPAVLLVYADSQSIVHQATVTTAYSERSATSGSTRVARRAGM